MGLGLLSFFVVCPEKRTWLVLALRNSLIDSLHRTGIVFRCFLPNSYIFLIYPQQTKSKEDPCPLNPPFLNWSGSSTTPPKIPPAGPCFLPEPISVAAAVGSRAALPRAASPAGRE